LGRITVPRPGRLVATAASVLAAHDDDLIKRLDGSRVSTDLGSWSITVYCVYTIAGQRWLQLGLTGGCDYAVTLRMPLTAEAPDARRALAEWLSDPASPDGTVVSTA
jgi:hypothetical protein